MKSDLGTRIMAAGLVHEGMQVESLEAELAKLKEVINGGKPICPVCMKPMQQQNYHGYYDSFSYWGCECESFPEAATWNGQYA